MRIRIAQEAARLMAEQGIEDFYTAKRKAAEQLGAPDTRNMPANQEVEDALASYQRLFQGEAQASHIRDLRVAALQAMRFLRPFSPRLAGSVLSGTASRYANINLHLFADTVEEVGLFLMEAGIPYQTAQKRMRVNRDSWRELPVYYLLADERSIELIVFPPQGLREAPRSPVDGKPMQRADIDQLESLLDSSEWNSVERTGSGA